MYFPPFEIISDLTKGNLVLWELECWLPIRLIMIVLCHICYGRIKLLYIDGQMI